MDRKTKSRWLGDDFAPALRNHRSIWQEVGIAFSTATAKKRKTLPNNDLRKTKAALACHLLSPADQRFRAVLAAGERCRRMLLKITGVEE